MRMTTRTVRPSKWRLIERWEWRNGFHHRLSVRASDYWYEY